MTPVFVYGTLCHKPLLDVVLGPAAAQYSATPARLPGHAVRWVEGQNFPVIRAEEGAVAEGLVLEGLSGEAEARLRYYEAGYRTSLQEVEVGTSGATRRCLVFFPETGAGFEPGAIWNLEDWIERWGEVTTLAAEEVMEGYGSVPPKAFVARYQRILARAASRLRARDGGPTTVRRRASPDDVQLISRDRPYAKYFAVEDYVLRHRRFDGKMSRDVVRATFISGDAVTVLPYDPVRDRVMLVEQFRMGPYARGDVQCWLLEAIAGRIDPGETPEEAARREAIEETGLQIDELHPVASYYPSPGAKAEFLYSFIAPVDLPDGAAGLGGADDEDEDIRAHLVDFDHAMALVDSGEIRTAPLLLSLQSLARLREQLRGGA